VYSREIQEKRQKPRHEPVENGIPVQGTWTEAFDEADLSSVHRPYSFPLLKRVKNLMIKEWESFIIQDDRFYLFAKFCNFKYYCTAIINIYNMETKELIEYTKHIPGGSWRLPGNLHNDSLVGRSSDFFFKIHTWLDHKSIEFEMDIKEYASRPAISVRAAFDLAEGKTTPMAVSLLFSERRNMYAYKALAAVRGELILGGQHIQLEPSKTSGIFCDFKGFFPGRKHYVWGSAMSFDKLGKRFGFTLGENHTKEPYSNNENALWIDGRLTPLPPVKITQNGNQLSDWIIQDMEGMVDLVFTPKELGYNMSSNQEHSLGFYNGQVLGSEGEEVTVRNVWGTGERLYLRV